MVADTGWIVLARADWLQIGKSFGKPTAGDHSSDNLQLAKPRKEKRHKRHHRSKYDDDRHGWKRKRYDEGDGHSRSRTSDALVVHKKHHLKRKSHRRSRSESSRDSSTSDDEHGRRHRHRRCHQRNRSRSRSVPRRSKDAQLATVDIQPRDQDIAIVKRAESDEKLFEFDRAGDRDNRFFGSTYASDQPIYELGSRRNLLTGEWVVPVRRSLTHPRREQSRDPLQGRYFGTEARKLERSGQQKRLYLAYSEKRIARQRQDQASAISSEMSFIPLDPVINSDVLLATEDSTKGETDTSPGSVLLTDAQNTEQYLVSRAKALNASVAENPRDVDAWLDLIAFQEQSLLLSDKDKKARAAAHKAMVDKQAAILNRALAANPDSRELQRLRINLTLHASLTNSTGAIDDFDATQRLLEELIDRDPTNKELWIKLIECHQQHFGNFTVLSIRNLFARIIAVLRKELEHSVDQALTVQISALLVRFHALMCSFEAKTGHTEHAVAQLQGLVDFTSKIAHRSSGSGVIRPHQELIDEFVGMWSRNDPHFGEEGALQDNDLKQLLEDGTLPQQPELNNLLELKFVTQIDSINPPDTIRSAEHKRLLLASSAAYQRRANRLKGTDDRIDRTNAEAVNDGSDEGNGGRMVYSNLHGRRILVDDADDAEEYERILSELRGRESSIARQAQLAQKDDKRRTSFVATVTNLEDQRANYDSVVADDPFVSWLMDEERQEYSQWNPLWPARIDHQDLIEAEPERAVMTDEIQPFLFVVPPRFEWDVICTLLEACGVHLRHRRGHSLYADKAVDCEVLAEPLFSSFEPRRYKPLSLSAQRRRELLSQELLATVRVQDTTVCDRSKIAFIRHIFAQSLCRIESTSKAKESPPVQPSTIKQMWIGFEDEVAARSSSKEASLVFARSLSQHLLTRQASTTEMDIPVLFEYAKMESRLGNDRQVERIFEKTLQSVRNESNGLVDREFHRLVFLRARQEAWGSMPARRKRTVANLSRLRALYVLWSPWQSTHEPLEALVKSYRKDWEGLKRYLEQTVQVSLLEARYREELDDAIRLCVQHDHNSDMEASRESSTCVVGFCLHNLALLLYCSRGIEAATEAYRRALDSNASTKCPCLQSRWIWLSYLELIQQHQTHCAFPGVSPRQWRSAVGQAVEALPGDALLLRLFVDAETGSTMSQSLRQHFLRVEKQWRRHFDSPELIEWLFTLLTEVARVERIANGGSGPEMDEAKDVGGSACCLSHRWGMNTPGIARIRAVFESMVSRVRTRGNALGWRLYLRFEVALGKVGASKKIFYRALARAPWSKELYLDGIRLLRPYLNKVECQELVEFMAAKELHVRVDV